RIERAAEAAGIDTLNTNRLIDAVSGLTSTTQDAARAKVQELVVDGQLSKERRDALVELNRLSDGTTDWIAVQQQAQAEARVAAGAQNVLTAGLARTRDAYREYRAEVAAAAL